MLPVRVREPLPPYIVVILADDSQDMAEGRNLYGERPEVVKRLKELLEKYKRDGRSTPGLSQRTEKSR